VQAAPSQGGGGGASGTEKESAKGARRGSKENQGSASEENLKKNKPTRGARRVYAGGSASGEKSIRNRDFIAGPSKRKDYVSAEKKRQYTHIKTQQEEK